MRGLLDLRPYMRRLDKLKRKISQKCLIMTHGKIINRSALGIGLFRDKEQGYEATNSAVWFGGSRLKPSSEVDHPRPLKNG